MEHPPKKLTTSDSRIPSTGNVSHKQRVATQNKKRKASPQGEEEEEHCEHSHSKEEGRLDLSRL
jgi:hypothetical protein